MQHEHDIQALTIEGLEEQLADAKEQIGLLKEYVYAAMELQDLLAEENSGIRINGATSSEPQMRKAIAISQRMWSARKRLAQQAPTEAQS